MKFIYKNKKLFKRNNTNNMQKIKSNYKFRLFLIKKKSKKLIKRMKNNNLNNNKLLMNS